MKKMNKLLGIIAFVSIIGFFMACNGGSTPTDFATVTISGTPRIGQKLTAASSSDCFGNFMWLYGDSATTTSVTLINSGISGDNDCELIIPETVGFDNLKDKYIFAWREFGAEGFVAEGIIGPVTY